MPMLSSRLARARRLLGWSLVTLVALLQAAPAWADEATDFFEARVRPLLVERCLTCHGDEKPKGGLSLTRRAAALTGGDSGPALVPGNLGESLLVAAVEYESEPRMPPKGKLAADEIAALKRWVELGAPWPDTATLKAQGPRPIEAVRLSHWAFQPVTDPVPPLVHDAGWVRTPVDRFILAALEHNGLAPAPEADRRTLLRRLSFDLTGLPPTAEEVAAFEADTDPLAYERQVERLLASPAYGERWARPWLDLARYSDTKGYVYAREERFWVHAWAYRDWVIGALNSDMPYDRFVQLQLAADREAGDDPAQQAAMGFLTVGRRFLGVTHDIADDRIDVVTRGTLGLTVACARCHDHKYDPIGTADYYALYGVFRNSSERQVPLSSEAGPEAFATELAAKRKALADRLDVERDQAARRVRARLRDYLLAQLELGKYPEEGFDQILEPGDIFPAFVRRWREAIARAVRSGDPVLGPWGAFARLKPEHFARDAERVCRALQTAPAGQVDPAVARAFGWAPASMAEVAARYAALFQEAEQNPDAPELDAVRQVLHGSESPCEPPREPIVESEAYFPTGATEALWQLQSAVDRLLIQRPEAPAHAVILVDREPTTEHRIFRRGNPAMPGDPVDRRFLEVLSPPGELKPFRDGSGRRELARAITDPGNPLTARVIVNRLWQGHFGEGLVRTPSDFGTRAEPPSHPELLDWLATDLIRSGWSLKTIHRQIVHSAAYRQSGTNPGARTSDPENRLVGRQVPRRLGFEETRDAILIASGDLTRPMGGKPVPPLPNAGPSRRSIYGLVDRQEFPSLFRSFDVANPDLHVPRRSESIVPQQALFFLNHPFLLGRARALVNRPDVAGAGSPEERIERLFTILYQRRPASEQAAAALALVQAAEAEPTPQPPETTKAWQYGHGQVDEAAGKTTRFELLPYFGNGAWQGGPGYPDGKLGWVQLTATGGHPGNDQAHAAIRRWVAPRDMAVRIESTLAHEVAQGDGVVGLIVSSRQGLLKRAAVHNSRAPMTLDRLELQAGETIDFVVHIGAGLNSDQHLWAPRIEELKPEGSPENHSAAGTVWSAEADFLGPTPERLGPWEQLAQVLFMTNEFLFVD